MLVDVVASLVRISSLHHLLADLLLHLYFGFEARISDWSCALPPSFYRLHCLHSLVSLALLCVMVSSSHSFYWHLLLVHPLLGFQTHVVLLISWPTPSQSPLSYLFSHNNLSCTFSLTVFLKASDIIHVWI